LSPSSRKGGGKTISTNKNAVGASMFSYTCMFLLYNGPCKKAADYTERNGKHMIIAYIIALAVIVILLFSAIRLHYSFSLHRSIKKKMKGKGPHKERTPHLHDFIFTRY
jgi:hypothetical protein